MRLFAAILPPREVLEELCRVVQSVNDPVPSAPGGRGRKKRFSGRASLRGAHASGEAPAATQTLPGNEPTTHELTTVPVDQMYLPLTGFGNVTLGDSVKLAKALRTDVASWRRPGLAFAGGTALEFPGDESAWVKIEGDIDDLLVIGRGVPQTVQRMGYFVDRRQFRPWFSVGTITDTTTAPYLERLVAALDDFHGQPWTPSGVSLMKWLPDTGQHTFEEIERMPLA